MRETLLVCATGSLRRRRCLLVLLYIECKEHGESVVCAYLTSVSTSFPRVSSIHSRLEGWKLELEKVLQEERRSGFLRSVLSCIRSNDKQRGMFIQDQTNLRFSSHLLPLRTRYTYWNLESRLLELSLAKLLWSLSIRIPQ